MCKSRCASDQVQAVVCVKEHVSVHKCELGNVREQVTLPEEPFAMLSGKRKT